VLGLRLDCDTRRAQRALRARRYLRVAGDAMSNLIFAVLVAAGGFLLLAVLIVVGISLATRDYRDPD
jgi:hypothetical protein